MARVKTSRSYSIDLLILVAELKVIPADGGIERTQQVMSLFPDKNYKQLRNKENE